jgi:diguanylate cyclase (GGDEF)-like protein
MLARAARAGASVSALYIDVDGFKAVNDTLGHAAGDELLRVIAARLSSSVRAGDTAARLSGDEFLVLAHDPGGEAGPPLARRLLAKLSEPYETVQGTEGALRVSVSIGVACGLPESPEELVRDADLALYAAKQAGRARYAVFRPAMTVEAQRRVAQSAARRASVQRRGVGAAEAAVDQEGRGGHEAGLRAG